MKNSRQVGFTIALLCCSLWVMAQPGSPAAPAPIGFIEVLIGGGMVYGAKKAYSKRGKEG